MCIHQTKRTKWDNNGESRSYLMNGEHLKRQCAVVKMRWVENRKRDKQNSEDKIVNRKDLWAWSQRNVLPVRLSNFVFIMMRRTLIRFFFIHSLRYVLYQCCVSLLVCSSVTEKKSAIFTLYLVSTLKP